MTTRPDFERNVAAWLNTTAGEGTPDYLEEIEARVDVVRQRAWWSSPERWLPMDLTARASTLPRPRLGPMLVAVALLVTLVVGALLVIGSSRRVPPPFGTARNGLIGTGDNGDIMLVNADGSGLRTVVAGPDQDEGITFSRDGTRMVFNRVVGPTESHVMVADADGRNLAPLADRSFGNTWWFDWSPTDDRVALASEVDGNGHSEIEVVNVADRSVQTITPSKLGLENVGFPLWRPADGKELIFTGDPAGPLESGLYAIHPDGTGLRKVGVQLASGDSYHTLELTPDGRYAVYWNIENDTTGYGHARTHVLDLTSGDDRTVTYGPPGTEASDPHISPDGAQVVSTRWLGGPGQAGVLQIAPLDASAAGRTIGPEFTNDDHFSAAFSPDGTEVVLSVDGNAPVFIDIASGKTTVSPSVFKVATWQRQAP